MCCATLLQTKKQTGRGGCPVQQLEVGHGREEGARHIDVERLCHVGHVGVDKHALPEIGRRLQVGRVVAGLERAEDAGIGNHEVDADLAEPQRTQMGRDGVDRGLEGSLVADIADDGHENATLFVGIGLGCSLLQDILAAAENKHEAGAVGSEGASHGETDACAAAGNYGHKTVDAEKAGRLKGCVVGRCGHDGG